MTYVSPKLRMTAVAVLFAFSTMMMVPAGALAQGPAAPPAHAKKITQTAKAFVQGTSDAGDALSGVLTIQNFATQGNQLVANGVLNGTLTSASGVVTPVSNAPVTLPVSSLSATCQILNLVLGPLNLNLLGLVIHLNTVHLNITAVPGPGNLLGNLLCAVAHLLDGTNLNGLLTQLVGLLNQILGAL